MLRLLKRSVNKTIGGLSLRRNEHRFVAESCLKWNEAYFNGVNVNLDQLGEQCNPEEFSDKLKGKLRPSCSVHDQ